MTPKEKTEGLIVKFKNSQDSDGYNDVRDIEAAKRCALIAVDEILSTIQDLKCEDVNWDYWIQVKQEIRNL